MSVPVFSKQLALITAIIAAVLFAFSQYPLFFDHQALYWIFLVFNLVAAGFLFVFGVKLASGANKNSFTLLVMGSSFAKMALTMAVLVAYLKLVDPASKYFILPFLLVYVTFAAFDAYFLMKIGRSSQ